MRKGNPTQSDPVSAAPYFKANFAVIQAPKVILGFQEQTRQNISAHTRRRVLGKLSRESGTTGSHAREYTPMCHLGFAGTTQARPLVVSLRSTSFSLGGANPSDPELCP